MVPGKFSTVLLCLVYIGFFGAALNVYYTIKVFSHSIHGKIHIALLTLVDKGQKLLMIIA